MAWSSEKGTALEDRCEVKFRESRNWEPGVNLSPQFLGSYLKFGRGGMSLKFLRGKGA